MTNQAPHAPSSGPDALAAALEGTLTDELDALVRLRSHFDDHITALRTRQKDRIDEATNRTNDEVNSLARLKQTRDRKLRLLSRVLRMEAEPVGLEDVVARLATMSATAGTASNLESLRAEIRKEAVRTQKRCQDLEFALEYAVHLGRDLLHALQGASPAGSTKVYTSKGGAIEKSNASFVNRIG